MYARNPGDGAGEALGELDQVLKPVAVEAARYICRRLSNVPKTSFVKYLYLTDREYAARHGHTMLGTRWWREEQGPLSSAITKMIRGPEFRQQETKTASGNARVGHVEAEGGPLTQLGSPEIAVLDTVLAEYGGFGQVELLDRVHALPEVQEAPMKSEIAIPTAARHRGQDYLADLLSEIERERAAGIYSNTFDEDEAERQERSSDALITARTLQ